MAPRTVTRRQWRQIERYETAFRWHIGHLRTFGARQAPPIVWNEYDPLNRDKATRLINAMQTERNRRYTRS